MVCQDTCIIIPVNQGYPKELSTRFKTLKQRLLRRMYPSFDEKFVLDTDAISSGLGAVCSQSRHGLLHPISFASSFISKVEKNYGIMELEKLAVVRVIQHYRACLYGHEVLVVTDHSAVKAILETPNPSWKHAHWWLKVLGSEVKSLEIKYHPVKDNTKADSLSQNPVLPADKDDMDLQVAKVHADSDLQISELLETTSTPVMADYHQEQQKDEALKILPCI